MKTLALSLTILTAIFATSCKKDCTNTSQSYELTVSTTNRDSIAIFINNQFVELNITNNQVSTGDVIKVQTFTDEPWNQMSTSIYLDGQVAAYDACYCSTLEVINTVD